MEYVDYYKVMDVGRSASADEISKSYKKLARKYHPDLNKDAGAESKFKEINEAYEVLKDPDKRSKYDRFGSAWQQAQTTGGPPPGFEDIFGFGFGGPGGARVEFGGAPSGFRSRAARLRARISAWSVPTSSATPASTPSGRSVTSRSTRTGVPKVGASSWMPPESVSTRAAARRPTTRSK